MNRQLRKFADFCGEREITADQADDSVILAFLTNEFGRGLKYSTLQKRMLQGTLTSIGNVAKVNRDHVIKMFMKGAYNLRPPVPKYHALWDTNKLLAHLETTTLRWASP